MAIDTNLYLIDGAHVIRKYLLAKLHAENLIPAVGSTGYPYEPFVPSRGYSELTDLTEGKPFIVYSYTSNNFADEWWITGETMVMRVYSDNEEQIRIISSYIAALLRRADWAVEDLNDWVNAGGDAVLKKFNFHQLQVNNKVGPEAMENEGGRQVGTVTVRYEYTRDQGTQHGDGMPA